MKKFYTAVCAMALIAGSLLFAQCSNGNQSAQAVGSNDSTAVANGKRLPIAYINTDSLLQKYTYAQELQEKLVAKVENDRANLNSRLASLRKEQEDFQRKYQNNAFLSAERAQQEYERLTKKEQDLQAYAQRLENENLTEQQKTLVEINDSIMSFIKEYNKTAGYEVILNSAATLYIDEAYDITDEVVELLNQRYKPTEE